MNSKYEHFLYLLQSGFIEQIEGCPECGHALEQSQWVDNGMDYIALKCSAHCGFSYTWGKQGEMGVNMLAFRPSETSQFDELIELANRWHDESE